MRIKSMFTGVALASALGVVPASADDLVFTLDNQSSESVSEFYVSTLQSESWEEDILGENVIPAGQSAEITISNADGRCMFDIRIVYEGGSVIEEREIDLCNLDDETYTVTD
jgi:hypothetical protein